VPTSLAQFTTTGTPIAIGGTTTETFYIVTGRVSDPDLNQVRLQVEVRQVGTAFIAAAIGSSSFVSSDGVATVVLALPPAGAPGAAGNYHWQARTNDINGANSDWVSFGSNTEADIDFICAPVVGTVPNVPTLVDQYRSNGATAVVVAATTTESRMIIKATISDPDAGDGVRLQVENRAVATAFTNAATSSSLFVASGAIATIEITGLVNGTSYHWQYRTQDGHGNVSAWTVFGGNLDGSPADPDYAVNTAGNTAPNAPAPIGQFTTANVAILLGGESGTTIRFIGTLSDSDLDGVRLQVEVRPNSTAFMNIVTGESGLVASGSPASVDVGSIPEGSYHWQYRTVDGSGATSAWTPMGGAPDFVVPSAPVSTSSKKRCGLLGLEALIVALILLRRKK